MRCWIYSVTLSASSSEALQPGLAPLLPEVTPYSLLLQMAAPELMTSTLTHLVC